MTPDLDNATTWRLRRIAQECPKCQGIVDRKKYELLDATCGVFNECRNCTHTYGFREIK